MVCQQRLASQLAVFWKQWIGHAVRKVSIRLVIDKYPLKRELGSQSVQYRTRTTITRVCENLERL
ncbi:hypothetical protein D3C76_1609030 [compost metagenome]